MKIEARFVHFGGHLCCFDQLGKSLDLLLLVLLFFVFQFFRTLLSEMMLRAFHLIQLAHAAVIFASFLNV